MKNFKISLKVVIISVVLQFPIYYKVLTFETNWLFDFISIVSAITHFIVMIAFLTEAFRMAENPEEIEEL